MKRNKKVEYTPLTEVDITRAGRLEPKERDHLGIHNMPESGEEGIRNEYSNNLPEARKNPEPISNWKLEKDSDKFYKTHNDPKADELGMDAATAMDPNLGKEVDDETSEL
jgi:hypothetical protein